MLDFLLTLHELNVVKENTKLFFLVKNMNGSIFWQKNVRFESLLLIACESKFTGKWRVEESCKDFKGTSTARLKGQLESGEWTLVGREGSGQHCWEKEKTWLNSLFPTCRSVQFSLSPPSQRVRGFHTLAKSAWDFYNLLMWKFAQLVIWHWLNVHMPDPPRCCSYSCLLLVHEQAVRL